ncbi:hypothetical protein IFM89_022409 [Coptis chinensis]|uniref:Uncharacterized protein n=1 Tax=Coptis chinensis TaxID=261450 RepID=A0A835I0P5_9MAGN|nr:hypothetical protein IFM89_022409 [Coptis chinensis]
MYTYKTLALAIKKWYQGDGSRHRCSTLRTSSSRSTQTSPLETLVTCPLRQVLNYPEADQLHQLLPCNIRESNWLGVEGLSAVQANILRLRWYGNSNRSEFIA